MNTPKQCPVCGTVFTSTTNKTCSKECAYTLGTQKRNKKVLCTCEVCGATKYRSPSHAKRRYCSIKCKGIASRTIEMRNCEGCGERFLPPSNHGDQRFCSNKCAGSIRRKDNERVCPICGKLFRRSGTRNKRYCSIACMSVGYLKPIDEIPCSYCKKMFTPKKRGSTHCSPICVAKAGGAKRVQYITTVCKGCGKPVVSTIRHKRAYCSAVCKRTSLSQKSTFNRFTGKQKQLIRQRDKYECVLCGSKNRLQVDHVIALALGGTNELSNGQTLCHYCHVKKTAQDRRDIKARKGLR